MTLIASDRQPTPPQNDIRELITPERVNSLRLAVNQAVAPAPHRESSLLSRVIADSINAFLECSADPDLATRRVASLMRRLGDEHARDGLDARQLGKSFKLAQTATLRGLHRAVGPTLTREAMNRLLQNAVIFLQQLHHETIAGWELTNTIVAMTDDERRNRLRSALLEANTLPAVDILAEFAQIDLAESYVIVVSAADELPRTLLDSPTVLAGGNSFEALMPASWVESKLAEHLESPFAAMSMSPQVVVGPTALLTDIGETAEPTRRSAELLRDGLINDPRSLVPCTDLLGSLLVDGNPKLTKLIVAKHLGPLKPMPLGRRLATGELLARWLESSLSVRQIADELGIPAQTAYSRMKTIRELFGRAIDDSAQRLELIIALQASLPRWRAENEIAT